MAASRQEEIAFFMASNASLLQREIVMGPSLGSGSNIRKRHRLGLEFLRRGLKIGAFIM